MKRTIFNTLSAQTIFLALLGMVCVNSAIAQDPDPNTTECVRDQYVLRVSPVEAVKDKALEAFDAATSAPIRLEDESSRNLLVEKLTPGRSNNDEVVDYNPRTDICRSMRANIRAELRQSREDGEFNLVRRFSCSCNEVLYGERTPNDEYFGQLWGLRQPAGQDISATSAWDIFTGSSNVVVAVIDTGIDYTHPDLANNIWRNPGEIAENGIDDDGNGWIDDIHGVNTINRSGDPKDDHSHGTHVAGTIGASGDNGVGVVGVNWQVKLMGVKFLASNGSGSLFNAMVSIDYVTDMKLRGVNIVASNNSWGGGGYSQPLYDAIARAKNAGLLFVAAAGNSSLNTDSTPAYPAGYELDNIISVAAMKSDMTLAYFSNYGARTVDIGAPGFGIASTVLAGGYSSYSGTSMAAPHVTGALALLKGYRPDLSWDQLKSLLFSSGRNIPALQNKSVTGKMINVYDLLLSAGNVPNPILTPTPTPIPQPTSTSTPIPTATPSPTPTPTIAPGYFSISGTVTVAGQGVASAKLILTLQNGTEVVRYTADNGEYRFNDILGPVSYTIAVQKQGYEFNNYQGFLISNTVADITGRSAALRYMLTTTLLSGDKTPIAGVNVQIIYPGGSAAGPTDGNGKIAAMIPYGVVYYITADAPGYIFDYPQLSGTIYGDVERLMVAGRE